jgi:hypothetical protein
MSKLDRNNGTFLTLAAVAALAAAGKRGRGPGIARGSQSRHRGDIMGYWNIPDEVYDYGTKHGLRGLATGGNIDYMAKPLGKEVDEGGSEVWAVLGSHEDAGSPENLDEPANINIFLDENWQRIIILPFKTAREAIEHMGTMLSINV